MVPSPDHDYLTNASKQAIETILLKYKEIFVEEEDTSGSAAASN